MNHVHALLSELGLSKQEIETYETALAMGMFPASTLGNRLCIPRSTARYACESLVKKGLMVETKKANTKLFAAMNPTRLFSILHEQEAEIARKKERLSQAVKELEERYNPQAKLPKITFYEGEDGVGRMFEELLTHPTVLYSFWAGDYFIQKSPELIESFRKKASKAYKEIYVMRSSKYEPLHRKELPNRHTKFFEHIDELKVDIQIIDDMLTIASIGQSTPVWIVIKHPEIVDAFKQVFVELWKKTE